MKTINPYLEQLWTLLTGVPPWAYGISFVLLLTVVLGWFFLRKSKGGKAKPEASEDAAQKKSEGKAEQKELKRNLVKVAQQVRRSFVRAKRSLHKTYRTRDAIYRDPWYLMLGTAESNKSWLLENQAQEIPVQGLRKTTRPPLRWWKFNKGIVLDPEASILFPQGYAQKRDFPWNQVLKGLIKHRPEEPLNGILLAISCEELLQLDLEEAEHAHTPYQKMVLDRLASVQKELGVRVPVYVMITQCEQLIGFEAFQQGLPSTTQDSLLGWSSPKTIDAVFQSSLIKAAFEQINVHLQQKKMHMLASRGFQKENDELFQVTTEVNRLSKPLEVMLKAIFQEHSYHESFFLRGFYLTSKGAFLNDLFERKIFPEEALAQPISKFWSLNHRLTRQLQIALAIFFILGTIGGPWALYQINQHREPLQKLLSTIEQQQQVVYSSPIQGEATSEEEFREQLQRADHILLDIIKQSDVPYLSATLIPGSWQFFDYQHIHQEIIQGLRAGYRHILLRAIEVGFPKKIEWIVCASQLGRLNPEVQSPTATDCAEEKVAPPPLVSQEHSLEILESPEFINIFRFVESAEQLNEASKKYNLIWEERGKSSFSLWGQQSSAAESIVEVQTFLFGEARSLSLRQAQTNSYHGAAFYQAKATPIVPARLNKPLLTELRRLLDLFNQEALGKNNPLQAELHTVQEALKAVEHRQTAKNALKQLKHLHEVAVEAHTLLQQTQNTWLAKKNLGVGFTLLMASIDLNPWLRQPDRLIPKDWGKSSRLAMEREIQRFENILPHILNDFSGSDITSLIPVQTSAANAKKPEAATADAKKPDAAAPADAKKPDAAPADAKKPDATAPANDKKADAATEENKPDAPVPAPPTPLELVDAELQQLVKNLDLFFELREVSTVESPEFRTSVTPAIRLQWNQNQLQKALDLVQSHQDFLDNTFPQFPVAIQAKIKTLTEQGLQLQVREVLVNAQSLEYINEAQPIGENEIDQRHSNLNSTWTKLLQLTNQMESWDGYALNRDIYQIMEAQAYQLLRDIHQLFLQEYRNPYEEVTFQDWNNHDEYLDWNNEGNNLASLLPFQYKYKDVLTKFLENRTAFVLNLSTKYAPLPLNILNYPKLDHSYPRENELDESVRELWAAISQQGKLYNTAQKTSALFTLDDFLSKGLDQEADQCLAILQAKQKDLNTQPQVFQKKRLGIIQQSDFFLVQRDQLLERLYQRCQQLEEWQAYLILGLDQN